MRKTRLAVPSNSVDAYDTALKLNLTMLPSDGIQRLKEMKEADFCKRVVKDVSSSPFFGYITMRTDNPSVFSTHQLTGKELEIFEAEVMRWGSLEAHETAKKVGREPWEVIRFYYRWRNAKLASENASMREEYANAKSEKQRQRLSLSYSLHEPPDVPAKIKTEAKSKSKAKGVRYLPKAHKAVTGVQSGAASVLGHQREATPESDAEGSVWEENELADAKLSCSACGVKKDTKWWKSPRSQQGAFLCNHCGSSYRKYGVSLPYRAHLERASAGEKRNSTPVDDLPSKRQKTTAAGLASKAATPPLPLSAPAKLAACAICYKLEPKVIARCRNCAFPAHPGELHAFGSGESRKFSKPPFHSHVMQAAMACLEKRSTRAGFASRVRMKRRWKRHW